MITGKRNKSKLVSFLCRQKRKLVPFLCSKNRLRDIALVVTSFLGGLICAQHSRDLDYQVLPLQNCSGFVRFASLLRHLRRSFFETQRRALYPVVLTCHGTSPTNTTQSSNPPLGKRLRLWVPMLVLSVLLGLLFLFFLYQFHQLAKDSWFHRTHADRDDSHA